MTRFAALLVAGTLFAAAPSLAQTVGSCARGGGANQPQAVWVLFDLGSSQVRAGDKPKITEAAATAKASLPAAQRAAAGAHLRLSRLQAAAGDFSSAARRLTW